MNAPIGVFDSGLGGLTVLREIERVLPKENLLYVGDTARVPYGVKSAETVTRYAQEICDFLLGQGVKAIVVACNTVSAVALPVLRESYSVPIIGVLEPGAQAAARRSRGGQIAVIGTESTIRSQSYPKAILRHMPQAQVSSRACPLFVPLVEEGWIDHEVTEQVARIYLEEGLASIDTLILGCTHYPLLKTVLQRVLGEDVCLVDSAEETAQALAGLLEAQGLLNRKGPESVRRYFSTDAPEKMRDMAQRFLGHAVESVQLTDLASDFRVRVHGASRS